VAGAKAQAMAPQTKTSRRGLAISICVYELKVFEMALHRIEWHLNLFLASPKMGQHMPQVDQMSASSTSCGEDNRSY